MADEIERRFLIDPAKLPKGEGRDITQAYLSLDPERTVRIRIIEDSEAFFTVKGKKIGMTCPEFEYAIPLEDAQGMLAISKGAPIEKTRYIVPVEGHSWEVDQFHGANEGLWIAEIELDSEDEDFVMPDWVVKEITDDPRYANAALVQNPFRSWGRNPNQDMNCSPS